MNTKHLAIAGPYTHENLSIFLLLGADALDGQRFIPLDDALEQKCVTVHETGDVGQLEVENLSEHFDLYIQAGDVVKGGRQDRTLGVDFVLPAKSGRLFAADAAATAICTEAVITASTAPVARSTTRKRTGIALRDVSTRPRAQRQERRQNEGGVPPRGAARVAAGGRSVRRRAGKLSLRLIASACSL